MNSIIFLYLVVESRRSNNQSSNKERDKHGVELPDNNSVNKEADALAKLEQSDTAENENHFLNQQTNAQLNAEQDLIFGNENNSVNQEGDAATGADHGETETSAGDNTLNCMAFLLSSFCFVYILL